MTTTDPTKADEFLPNRAWSAARPHLVIMLFIIATWGPAVANAVVAWLGGSIHFLFMGAPTTVAGAWADQAVLAIVAVMLSIGLVGRADIGLVRNGKAPEDKQQWHTVAVVAAFAMLAATILVSIFVVIGVPHESPAFAADPLAKLAYRATAGLDEEVPMAAMAILMLRAKWSLPLIFAVIVGLRVAYHMYMGYAIVVPATLLGGVFLWLFLRYRMVVPLIFAHTVLNVGSGLREIIF